MTNILLTVQVSTSLHLIECNIVIVYNNVIFCVKNKEAGSNAGNEPRNKFQIESLIFYGFCRIFTH